MVTGVCTWWGIQCIKNSIGLPQGFSVLCIILLSFPGMHSFPELIEVVAQDVGSRQIRSIIQADSGDETFRVAAQVKCVHGHRSAGHAYHPRTQNVPTAAVAFDAPARLSQTALIMQ